MDSSVVIQLIILVILLLLSAFFSSAETALTTANKIRIRTLADEGNKRAKTLLHVTNNSGKIEPGADCGRAVEQFPDAGTEYL